MEGYRKCNYCGDYFKKSEDDKQRYCSEDCHQKYLEKIRKQRAVKTGRPEGCLFCGKILPKNAKKYCCKLHERKYNDIKKGVVANHGELTKKCVVCGEEFKTWKSNKICCSSECSKKWHNGCKVNKTSRKEYDHQKYLKKHPGALTLEERNKIRREQKLARLAKEAPERERKRKEREAKEREWAENRAKREAQKQANIAYWQNYEAEHECDVCGNKFIAHYPLTKYCSKSCARKAHKVRDNRHRYKNITVDKGITLPKLAKRDRNQCKICGLFVDWNDFVKTDKTKICGDMYPSIDHITPISLGGLHSWDNVQLAHRGCNAKKNNRFIG